MTGSLLSDQFEPTNNIKMTMYLQYPSNLATLSILKLSIVSFIYGGEGGEGGVTFFRREGGLQFSLEK